MEDKSSKPFPEKLPQRGLQPSAEQTTASNSSQGVGADNADTSKSNLIEAPSINLPKGGGAIKSIDEKFSVNSSNGTAAFSIPLPLSKSMNDFAPALTMAYNSGSGNGIHGLGWTTDFLTIRRKTEKELPRYNDRDDSDTFIFSGSEDLVLQFKRGSNGTLIKDKSGRYLIDGSDPGVSPEIKRYRPRIEGAFARIEKIEDGDNVYWKVISKDNVTSLFGKTDNSKIYDPDDPSKIFEWLLDFSYDDKGNCYMVEYKKEDLAGITSETRQWDRNTNYTNYTNRYPKRVKYCNKNHFTAAAENDFRAETGDNKFLLELVFDYGEHNLLIPTPDEETEWKYRDDAFSSFRSGFDIRTTRVCSRVLMFHHFDDLGVAPYNKVPYLVKSLDFDISNKPANSRVLCYLNSITLKGYIWNGAAYQVKAFPPMDFTYEDKGWDTTIKTISPDNMLGSPVGIDDKNYQWADLFSEGISGILTEQDGAIYYKSNLGSGEFSPPNLVSPKPSLTGIPSGELQLQDLEANGNKFLVSYEAQGYYEMDEDEEWLPFRNFEKLASINFRDPNLKFIDLNGDGLADIMISEDEVLTCRLSLGREGFDDFYHVRKSFDEEMAPNIVFADDDRTQAIVLTDLVGDGSQHIARIRNGEVCYWPHLGYGKFGRKITMSNSPVFDNPESFNPKFIKLADIDGSGTTDIIYLGKDNFKVFFNQSGNSFSEENLIDPFFHVDDLLSFSTIDLLGNGTICLVGSSPLPNSWQSPVQYIDLMGGKKPHLMTGYKNNMGKETNLTYQPSTQFYLEDKKAGTPWVSKLPFPVQCVSEVEVIDRITRNRFVTLYSYHHGYYDGIEREFRGFGRVDQADTQYFDDFVVPAGVSAPDPATFQKPVKTKTWYHTGGLSDENKIVHLLEAEYYRPENFGGVAEKILSDTPLDASLSPEEINEAYRACKGLPLRIEVYALDSDEEPVKSLHPYSTAQHTCVVKCLQPQGENKYGVFLVHEREALTYHYERMPSDPRTSHDLIVSIDDFGNVLESVSIAYKRQGTDSSLTSADQDFQNKQWITHTTNSFTKFIDDDTNYRLPVNCETATFELTGWTASDFYLGVDDFTGANAVMKQMEISYEDSFDPNLKQRRLFTKARHIFLKDDMSGPLPLGIMQALALPFESYTLAFTESMIDSVFGPSKKDLGLLSATADGGAYLNSTTYKNGLFPATDNDNDFWVPLGRQGFDAINFYQVISVTDAFGNSTLIEYDSMYHFYFDKVTDAIGNIMQVVKFHFRTLLPWLISDFNDNFSAVRFDEMGMVISSFVMGKTGETENSRKGDQIDLNTVEQSLNDHPSSMLEYDVAVWYSQTQQASFDPVSYTPSPNFVKTMSRENHYWDEPGNANPKIQTSYTYGDGSGNEVMKKIQAEPGNAPERDNNGRLIKLPDGSLSLKPANPRYVGTGRKILNNKGNVVKQYEPFFSAGYGYEDEEEVVETGVTVLIHFDPLDRAIKTDYPDGSFSTVEFDAWTQKSFDQNDTVKDSNWYTANATGINGDALKEAAAKALVHYNTPAVTYFDALGRVFLSVADNKYQRSNETSVSEEIYKSHSELDIEGNRRSLTDARGNIVMKYSFAMNKTLWYQISMDSGERWILHDAAGKDLRHWDSRQNVFSYKYDLLHRPTEMHVSGGDGAIILDNIFDKVVYGENAPKDKSLNLRGKPFTHYDTAGITTMNEYDFKGSVLDSSRQLLKDYKNTPDWQKQNDLENDVYVTASKYDALKRITLNITPDNSITRPVYNEANLLEQLLVTIKNTGSETAFISNIDYNEKGQRVLIQYGNSTQTIYEYDRYTFRLTHILTTRNNGSLLQDLNYTYDPIGNITQAADNAQATTFFSNFVAQPINKYTYDAIYRLIEANGREHAGQVSFGLTDNYNDIPFLRQYASGDQLAMRPYAQKYYYDAVGNILQMQHTANVGSWTRINGYAGTNNQIQSSTVGTDKYTYAYNIHGSMKTMPQLSGLDWNFKEEMSHADLGGGGNAYYVYDSNGQRMRKTIERMTGTVKLEDRVYVGNYEVYRQVDTAGNGILRRETLHIMDGEQRIALVDTPIVKNDPGEQQLLRYQYSNHLGSACLELTGDPANVQVIFYEEYHPFGTTSYQASDKKIKAASKRYRFIGKERDDETGLNYHGARYYALWLGRWINTDPGGISDGPNMYAYAKDNPTRLIDQNGYNGQPPQRKLNDVVPYSEKLKNRRSIGTNVQKDHIIAQEKIRGIRTDPQGVVHYDPHKDPTVVVETGKARGGKPAKPHTKKTFHDPQADVKEIKRLREEGIKSFTGDIVEPSREAAIRSGMKPESVDQAIKGQLDNLHSSQTLEETAAELKRLEDAGGGASKAGGELAKEGATALEKGAVTTGKEALTEAEKTGAKAVAKKLGTKAAKFVPFVGIAVGVGLVGNDIRKGDYKSAAWDVAEAIPVVGDVVGAGHAGIEGGEALEHGLGVSDASSKAGNWVREKTYSTLGDTGSLILGGIATVAATPSAIGYSLAAKIDSWRH